jgi:integrase
MVDGVRYREVFDTLVEAEVWELEARTALKLGKPLPEPIKPAAPDSAFQTLGGVYKHTCKTHWETIASGYDQRRNGRRFVDFVGHNMPPSAAFTSIKADEYLAELRRLRCSNGTINRHLSAVSKMARVALRAKVIEEMPDLPWQKEGKGRLRTYTKDEVAGIIKIANQWGYEREADLFQFLIDTGARLGESAKVRWQDFGKDFESVTFYADITKTDQTRTIPLFPASRAALRRRWTVSAGDRGPFTGMDSARTRKPWYRIREFLKLGDEATLHTFRHTRATWFAQEGRDFWRIQKWMGHASLATTRKYTHLVANDLDSMLVEKPPAGP